MKRPDIDGLRDTYNRYVRLVNKVYATKAEVDEVYPECSEALRTIKEAFPDLHDYILDLEAERNRYKAALEQADFDLTTAHQLGLSYSFTVHGIVKKALATKTGGEK